MFVYGYDFRGDGGWVRERNGGKMVKVEEVGLKKGSGVMGVKEWGGGGMEEGVKRVGGYGCILYEKSMG